MLSKFLEIGISHGLIQRYSVITDEHCSASPKLLNHPDRTVPPKKAHALLKRPAPTIDFSRGADHTLPPGSGRQSDLNGFKQDLLPLPRSTLENPLEHMYEVRHGKTPSKKFQ